MYQMFVKTPTGGRVNLGVVRTHTEAEKAKASLSTYGYNVGYEPVTIATKRIYLYRKGDHLKLHLTLGYDPTDEKQPYRWKIHCAESPFPVHCGSWFIGLPWEKMHEHLKREGFELSYMVKNDKAYHLASKLVLKAQVIAPNEMPWCELKQTLLKAETTFTKFIDFDKNVERFCMPGDGFEVRFCPIDESTSLYNLYREEKVWEEV